MRSLAEACAIVLLLGAGACVERSAGGVESLYVAAAVLLGAGLFRRWLAHRGRVEASPSPVLGVELLALLGLVERPFARWGVALAGLAALARAWPRRSESEVAASRGEEAVVAASALLALAATLGERTGGAELALHMVLLAVLVIEAWGPGAARSVEAAARRVSSFGLVLALAVVTGFERVETWGKAQDVLFLITAVVALRASSEIAARPAVAVFPATRWAATGALVASLGTGGAAVVLGSDLVLGFAAPVAVAALLVVSHAGGLPASDEPAPRARLAFALATTLLLGAGAAQSWDDLNVVPDSSSYVHPTPFRTVLYPAFVDLFDRAPEAPRAVEGAGLGPRALPGHRFLGVIHAQKLLAIASIGLLAWLLSGLVPVAWAAAIVALAVVGDLLTPLDAAVRWNLTTLYSEGLNHPLVFLELAALLSYTQRPTWARGAALAFVLGLLLLNRPANLPLVAVLGFVLLVHHARGDGLARGALRAVALGALAAIPLAAGCAAMKAKHGQFRLHAFTGYGMISTALQVATDEDVAALEDPLSRELLATCLADGRSKRIADTANPYWPDANTWEIAAPAVEKVLPRADLFERTDALAKLARALVARHPREFAAIVLGNLALAANLRLQGLALVTCVVALALYRRSRSPRLLFVLALALLPVLQVGFVCASQYPHPRYRSQLAFAELVASPLLAALVASSGALRTSRRSDGQAEDAQEEAREDDLRPQREGEARGDDGPENGRRVEVAEA